VDACAEAAYCAPQALAFGILSTVSKAEIETELRRVGNECPQIYLRWGCSGRHCRRELEAQRGGHGTESRYVVKNPREVH
jgi:hypothetical protein